MDITIERRTIDAMTIVALRGVIPTYSDERLLWDRMMPELVRQGVTPNGPCGVIEHDREYTECDVDQEIFVLVAPGTQVATPLMIHELPARDCLVARLVGPYEGITPAYNLLAEKNCRGRACADGRRFP